MDKKGRRHLDVWRRGTSVPKSKLSASGGEATNKYSRLSNVTLQQHFKGEKLMLNKVIITGRLVSDPELRYTPSNKAVATARIASPRDYKNQNGERETDFINLVIWGKAENFANWIKKGYLVTVEGRLQTRSYENQEGQKVYVTEVNVSNFDNLQPRDHSNSSSQSPDFGPAEGGFPGGGEPLDDSMFENIPF